MRRRTLAGLIGLALLAYAVGLVATLPAARVLAWSEPQGLTVHGASGAVWAGRADRVDIHRGRGLPPLTEVSWDVVAWRLLTAQLHADIEAAAAGLQADGRLGITLDDEVLVEGLTVRGPVAGLARQAPLPVAAEGALLARIESARITAGVPREVSGRAVWSGARLVAPVAVALGEVVVTVEPAADGQRAVIAADGGEVEIDGSAQLAADGQYNLDLTLKPTAAAGQQLEQMLQLVARPNARGEYRIRRSGRLR